MVNRTPPATDWVFLYLAVVVYRLYLCAQPPADSSDLFRHLGWASHLFEQGPALYDALPTDFAPEFWTRFWSHEPYIYPPGALLFFSAFSTMGLGLFYVKAALTVLDAAAALLVWRIAGPLCGLLMLSAPAAMWYTSHEGQYEGLLNLCLVASVFLVRRRRWVGAGATWGLALQLKLFAVLMLPWFIAEVLAVTAGMRRRVVLRLSYGLALTTLVFVPFYLIVPDLWLRPFEAAESLRYNPFHWNLLDRSHYYWNPLWLVSWNAAFTYTIVFVLAGHVLSRTSVVNRLSALPALGFWSLLKIVDFAEFWYVNCAPGLTIGLRGKPNLLMILFVIYWLQCGRSIALLIGVVFGYWESPEVIEHFKACLWTCNYGG